MKRILLATISAVFIGALVTEIYSRLFAGNYFALLVLVSLGAAAASLIVSARFAAPAAIQGRAKSRGGAARKTSGRDSERAKDRGQSRKPAATSSRQEETPAEASAVDHSVGDREIGTVKWFNRKKGFGFIVRENGEEIFVHYRSVRGADSERGTRHSLRDGQTVAFRVVEKAKGPQADDVSPVEDPRVL